MNTKIIDKPTCRSKKSEKEESEKEERAVTLKCLILYDDYLKECN